jgi:negative regulator of sigma E activity
MTTDHAELLSALMDREDVDPVALAAALDDPEARTSLLAFAAVRRSLHEPAPGEHDWVARQARRLSARPASQGFWRVAAAAALLVAGLAAGVAGERYRSVQRPPEPSRVVQLDPLPIERR